MSKRKRSDILISDAVVVVLSDDDQDESSKTGSRSGSRSHIRTMNKENDAVIDLTSGADNEPPIPIHDVIDLSDYNSDGEEIWIDRECCICFETVTFSKNSRPVASSSSSSCSSSITSTIPYFSFPECKHVYCLSCFSSWITSVVVSGSQKFPLKCAVPDCPKTLAPCRKLKHALTLHKSKSEADQIFGRFVDKYIIATTDSMFCPNKACSILISPSLVDVEAEERIKKTAKSSSAALSSFSSKVVSLVPSSSGQCYQCQTKVCYSCKCASHEPLTCEAYKKIPIQDRAPEDLALFKMIGEKKWSNCPSCKVVVEKVQGCNHIVCRCGTCFCYRCGNRYLTKAEEKLKSNKNVAGPRNTHGTPTCKCNLFDTRMTPAAAPYRPPPPPRPAPVPHRPVPVPHRRAPKKQRRR